MLLSQLKDQPSRWFLLALAAVPHAAHAGMPSLSLTEVAAARLDVISFFIATFLLSTLLLRWAWNVLARDFTWLPQLHFKQAMGLMLICSLFLYVVLTMISGARELMTPGAWVKSGATYQLANPDRDGKTWLDSARRTALEDLRDALAQYAKAHGGNLPPNKEDESIPSTLWIGIHPSGESLAYIPGRNLGAGLQIVAYEPDAYGGQRFVLLQDGTVIRISARDLKKRLLSEPLATKP